MNNRYILEITYNVTVCFWTYISQFFDSFQSLAPNRLLSFFSNFPLHWFSKCNRMTLDYWRMTQIQWLLEHPFVLFQIWEDTFFWTFFRAPTKSPQKQIKRRKSIMLCFIPSKSIAPFWNLYTVVELLGNPCFNEWNQHD